MKLFHPVRSLKKLGRLEILVAASIVLLATVLLGAHRYMSDTFDSSRDWSVAVDTLRVRLTESHLWLEERIAGDQSIDVARQIYGNIDAARAQCRGLTDGRRSALVDIPRLPAGEARRATAMACGEISTLRIAAARRLGGRRDDVGQAPDQAYDQAFEHVLALTDEAERGVTKQVDDQHALLTWVNAATIAFLAFLLGGIVVIIRRGQGAASEARHLLSAANDAILIADHAGVITAANPVAGDLFGSARLKGRTVCDVLPCMGRDPSGWLARSEQVLARADATITLDVASTMTRAAGRAERFLIMRDITASKQLQERLERSMLEVEDRSRRPDGTADSWRVSRGRAPSS